MDSQPGASNKVIRRIDSEPDFISAVQMRQRDAWGEDGTFIAPYPPAKHPTNNKGASQSNDIPDSSLVRHLYPELVSGDRDPEAQEWGGSPQDPLSLASPKTLWRRGQLPSSLRELFGQAEPKTPVHQHAFPSPGSDQDSIIWGYTYSPHSSPGSNEELLRILTGSGTSDYNPAVVGSLNGLSRVEESGSDFGQIYPPQVGAVAKGKALLGAYNLALPQPALSYTEEPHHPVREEMGKSLLPEPSVGASKGSAANYHLYRHGRILSARVPNSRLPPPITIEQEAHSAFESISPLIKAEDLGFAHKSSGVSSTMSAHPKPKRGSRKRNHSGRAAGTDTPSLAVITGGDTDARFASTAETSPRFNRIRRSASLDSVTASQRLSPTQRATSQSPVLTDEERELGSRVQDMKKEPIPPSAHIAPRTIAQSDRQRVSMRYGQLLSFALQGLEVQD
ncbi:hypothetical protein DL93DRAFT_2234507 [Clavulina sp. PMI_390]|nr:hypothetical protein DL93DRAFT_2234507 [Clavulina sp. PMI_390]